MVDKKYIKRGMAKELAAAMLGGKDRTWYLPYIKEEYLEKQVNKEGDVKK